VENRNEWMNVFEKALKALVRQVNVIATAFKRSETLKNIASSCVTALLDRLQIPLIIPNEMKVLII
jgi:hypothetical protein